MTKYRKMLLFALVLVALAHSAWATMIVVVYTKDGYWIGADSLRSGGKKELIVCKIHETKFGLLAKSGASQGETESGELYSTDKEIEDLLATSQTADSFKAQLRMKFKQEIDQELAFLVDDPGVNASNLERLDMSMPIPSYIVPRLKREVILFDPKSSIPTGEILSVVPQSDMHASPSFKIVYKYWAPSIYGWHSIETLRLLPSAPTHYASSIRQFSHMVKYDRLDTWIQDHPRQAVEEMLDSGHLDDPEHIGPPYSIVHMTTVNPNAPKIEWVAKGVCPGWSETIDAVGSLTELRDEMRKQEGVRK